MGGSGALQYPKCSRKPESSQEICIIRPLHNKSLIRYMEAFIS